MTSTEATTLELDALPKALDQSGHELSRFVEAIKQTSLPFLPCDARAASAIYRDVYQLLYALGAHSVPLGVALGMHLYMLCAWSCFPITNLTLERRRRAFLDLVKSKRLIVANAGEPSRPATDGRLDLSTRATSCADGYVISGHKRFVSLACVADILVFTAALDAQLVSFYATLRHNPRIRVTGAPFGEAMDDSGTRSLSFDELVVSEDQLVTGVGVADFAGAHVYQRAWFQALIPAVYLGAAEAALAATRQHARSAWGGGAAGLAEHEGFVADLGRQLVALRAASSMSDSVALSLARTDDSIGSPEAIADFSDRAATLKYVAMRSAEDALTEARRMIGTRAMHPTHIVYRLTQQIPLGPLHPECEAQLERRLGYAYLTAR